MRDFLYSEIANVHRITNLPDDPQLAIAAGKRLCEELLEPLQATFAVLRSVRLSLIERERLRQRPRLQLRVQPTQLRPPHMGSA